MSSIPLIYPSNFESKIGFASVRSEIAQRTISPMGSELVSEMDFSSVYEVVEHRLSATREMLDILESGNDIPLNNLRDIRPATSAIRVPGTFPSIQHVLDMRAMLQSASDIRAFFDQTYSENSITGRGESVSAPVLSGIVSPLGTFPALIREIDRITDKYGNIKDNASPTLADIRSRLRAMDNAVNAAMRRVLARAVAEGLVEKDVAPSLRDGRLVIPLPPMHKRKIQGIVHDESSTGKTVFVEPAEVVEANNQMRSLQMDEHREVIKILTTLADVVRPHIPQMLKASEIIGMLDFIHAKALYAKSVGANMPSLTDEPALEWYHACHPVLLAGLVRQGKEIVPLDITLDQTNRLLVISGPNAGGKSVCLKTVGINQYMAQCGVLPVVYGNSRFGIFEDIFIDIGDDQSIENDLSTYSSHIASMKAFLRGGSPRSMILIDEFGSGTEPQIGAAIAQAILDRFNQMKMWGVVTTHYQNLKHFAEETDGLINGSMLYDRHMMRPLFRLSIGSPGSSFAIEIARKIGLPGEVIEEAERIVGSDYINMDRYLLDVARDKKYWENKRAAIRKKEKHLEEVIARYESDAETLRQKRSDIISEARSEARKIMEGTNAVIERTIRDIRRAQAEKAETMAARREMKEELDRLTGDNGAENAILRKAPRKKRQRGEVEQQKIPSESGHVLVEGDHVRLDGEGQVGTVMSIDGRKATVAFGNLKTSVDIKRLKFTTAQVKSASSTGGLVTSSSSDAMRTRQLNFKQDIDLRGMRADEAIQAVTYFIDDAIQFSIPRVRILHGTGTGALRQAVRAYLATVPGVVSFHDEHVQFGGTGITVVDLQ